MGTACSKQLMYTIKKIKIKNVMLKQRFTEEITNSSVLQLLYFPV